VTPKNGCHCVASAEANRTASDWQSLEATSPTFSISWSRKAGRVISCIDVSSDHKSQLLSGVVGSIALPLDCSVKCVWVRILEESIEVRIFDDTRMIVSMDSVKL